MVSVKQTDESFAQNQSKVVLFLINAFSNTCVNVHTGQNKRWYRRIVSLAPADGHREE